MKVLFRQDKYFTFFAFCEFSRFRLACTHTFYCIKISFNTQRTKIKNRKRYVRKKLTLPETMSFTSWVTRMWIHLQDLGQTLRVLLNNYLHPHHVLNPCVSSHCLFKLQLKLSHQPQVQLYSRKTSPNLKNPWVLNLTSNYNNKWVYFQASMLEAMKSL